MAFDPNRPTAAPSYLLSRDSFSRRSMSLKGPDESSIPFPLYAYFFFLNPLTFYLNTLWLLLHVTTHAGAPEAPLSVFLMKHLPRAAHTVSFLTLFFAMPLWIQAAVTEESIGFAIGAILVCLVLISLLTSVFNKLLISCCHAGRSIVPALLALCVYIGFLNSVDTISSFSNTSRYIDPFLNIAFHYLLLFILFFIFLLGMILLSICISAPAGRRQATIQVEHLAIVALSVAFATLLIAVYMKIFAAATMAAVGGDW